MKSTFRRRHVTGFTLVELGVGTLAASLLILVTASLSRVGLGLFRTADSRLSDREACCRILSRVRSLLEEAQGFEELGPGAYAIRGPAGRAVLRFDPSSGDLAVATPQGRDVTLITGRVETFRIEEGLPGYVEVTLQVTRDGGGLGRAPLAPLRVTDEVLVPCRRVPDLLLPFQPWYATRDAAAARW